MENMKNMSDADAFQFFSKLVNNSETKPVFVVNGSIGLCNENESDFDVFQDIYSCFVIENHPEMDHNQVLDKCKECWETVSEEDKYKLIHGSPLESNEVYFKLKDIASKQ